MVMVIITVILCNHIMTIVTTAIVLITTIIIITMGLRAWFRALAPGLIVAMLYYYHIKL